jgi:hypothetical protein
VTIIEITTPEEHRAEAYANANAGADSFNRCDTDGALSQWAFGIMRHAHLTAAKVADNGGVWTFYTIRLERLDGEAITPRLVETKYGERWYVPETDEWLAYQPKRVSTLERRGYREVRVEETVAAQVELRGENYTVRAYIIRADSERGWYPVLPTA